MSALPKHHYTPEEYLALEEAAAYRSEYLDGQIYAMSGGSEAHDAISVNIIAYLHNQFRGRNCRVYTANMRVKVRASDFYAYPDVSALCGEPLLERQHGDSLLNPSVIIEILSPSTEKYDRGKKFARYQTLDTLQEYILVSQDEMRVEHYTRQGKVWVLEVADTPDAVVYLPSLDATLSLAEIYAQVHFPPPEYPES